MFRYAEDLYSIITSLGIRKSEVCILGSVCMAIRGYKDNQDIEFILPTKVRERVMQSHEDYICSITNPYSGIINFNNVIECHKNSLIMFGITDDMAFDDAYCDRYEEYYVIKPEIYIALKRLANRIKDEAHLSFYRNNSMWQSSYDEKADCLLSIAESRGWDLPIADKEKLWTSIFNSYEHIYIFGTGNIARHVFNRVVKGRKCFRIDGFIVSDRGENEFFLGRKLLSVDEVLDKRTCVVLVAVALQNMAETTEVLRKKGFENIIQAYQFWIK